MGMVLGTNPSGRGRGKKLYPPRGWGQGWIYCINRWGSGWEFQYPPRHAPFASLVPAATAIAAVDDPVNLNDDPPVVDDDVKTNSSGVIEFSSYFF